jgi:hypothetical protein
VESRYTTRRDAVACMAARSLLLAALAPLASALVLDGHVHISNLSFT